MGHASVQNHLRWVHSAPESVELLCWGHDFAVKNMTIFVQSFALRVLAVWVVDYDLIRTRSYFENMVTYFGMTSRRVMISEYLSLSGPIVRKSVSSDVEKNPRPPDS